MMYSLQKGKTSPLHQQKTKKKRCPEYDSKLYMMVKLQSDEQGVLPYCHYFQVHSDPEW